MKKIKLRWLVFAFAILTAFLSNSAVGRESKSTVTQTVYYNIGTQLDCPNSRECSCVNTGFVCVAGITTYYDSQASPCTAVSTCKWHRL